MKKDNYRQLHVDFELTNNINSAKRMMNRINKDTVQILHQIIGLIGYKYLSKNLKYTNNDVGYELNDEFHYENLLINKANVMNTFKEGIAQITQNNDNIQAADVFYDLFDYVDFKTFSDNDTWLVLVEIAEKLSSQTMATLGEIIIFITKYISSIEGKHTEHLKPTEDIIKLITTNQKDVKNIYDPFTDEATLLAEIGNAINVKNYYGQHPSKENCILAKMTLLANDINYKNIFIKCNDILEPVNWNVKFDLCVSIPPFNQKIKVTRNDERFKPYTPKRSEFAYLLDMLFNLNDNGTIKMIVPNGVLFSVSDKKILKYLADNNLISSIIGLPEGLFDSTSIATALITINEKSESEGIYYLNAINSKTKKELQRKTVNIVNIDEYIDLLSDKKEEKLKSKIATIEEIRANDYNLTVNRYVDLEELKVVDIEKTTETIKKIKREIKIIDEELDNKIKGLFEL